MTIKVTTEKPCEKDKNYKFPLLMSILGDSSLGGTVLLVSGFCDGSVTGTVVKSVNKEYPVGRHSLRWTKNVAPFYDTILLSNED